MNLRKVLLLALKGAISLSLIAWVLSGVGIENAIGRLAGVSLAWVALTLALGVVQIAICAFRWGAVMESYDLNLRISQLFRFFYMGAFFNQALPSTIGGDVVRVYKLQGTGVGLGPAIGGVLIDRVVTVLALLVLVVAMIPFAATRLGPNADAFALTVWLLLAAGLAGTAVLMVLDRIPARFTHLPGVGAVSGFAADIRRSLLAPRTAFVILLWSVAGHVNLALMAWTLAQGLSTGLALGDSLMLFPLVLLLQTLPISIAGWGVREGAMVQIFALVHLPAEAALAISLLFGIVMLGVSLPGGLIWVKSAARDPRRPGT